MYSLRAYGAMIADSLRRRAYIKAMEAAIQPGCTVLEIGTGPGVFALLAARMGARKVYAVEPDDSIEVGRQLAAVNGLSDRIEFLQASSTELELAEKADVIISDLRGVLPLYRLHLPSIIDARERLLAPGGELIPCQDSLWASVITAEDLYRDHTQGWSDRDLGLDLDLALDLVTNSWSKVAIAADQCLVEPQRWAVLDYPTLRTDAVSGSLRWQVSGGGLAHGVAVWFDTRLNSSGGYSNAPGQPEQVYGRAFFPFSRPLALRRDDQLSLDLAAVRSREDYIWRWLTTVSDVDGVRERLEQSTFHGLPLSPAGLNKRASNHLPRLGENGLVLRFILARMDGKLSIEDLAQELRAEFPTRFASQREALAHVGDVAEAYA